MYEVTVELNSNHTKPPIEAWIQGAYFIHCRRTRRYYVGSSTYCVARRFHHHRHMLRSGKHHCAALQRDWDKYGPNTFTFVVAVVCPAEQARQEEQKLLDNGWSLYNRSPSAGSNAGVKYTEESRALMSEKSRERNARPDHKKLLSERAKAQHAAGKLGRITWKKDSQCM